MFAFLFRCGLGACQGHSAESCMDKVKLNTNFTSLPRSFTSTHYFKPYAICCLFVFSKIYLIFGAPF